jgi:hypothetical protein
MADESKQVRKSREDRAAILSQANEAAAELIAKGYPALRGFEMCDPQYRPVLTIELMFDFDAGEIRARSAVSSPSISDQAKRKIPIAAQ